MTHTNTPFSAELSQNEINYPHIAQRHTVDIFKTHLTHLYESFIQDSGGMSEVIGLVSGP
jgi:hypothetical protein